MAKIKKSVSKTITETVGKKRFEVTLLQSELDKLSELAEMEQRNRKNYAEWLLSGLAKGELKVVVVKS